MVKGSKDGLDLLLKEAASVWLTSKKYILSDRRYQHVNRARYTFTALALLSGYTKRRIMDYTGWSDTNVTYYAGKALVDDKVFEYLQKQGVISVS